MLENEEQDDNRAAGDPETGDLREPMSPALTGGQAFPMPVVNQGVPGPANARFCSACGAGIVKQAIVCPNCGSPVGGPMKDKTVAVLLAVFLGVWTWLYTYQRSKVKFWSGIGLSVLGLILTIVVVGYVVLFGVWLWAVIDTATKPQSWYTSYSTAA